jgi:hypothetical protein
MLINNGLYGAITPQTVDAAKEEFLRQPPISLLYSAAIEGKDR